MVFVQKTFSRNGKESSAKNTLVFFDLSHGSLDDPIHFFVK